MHRRNSDNDGCLVAIIKDIKRKRESCDNVNNKAKSRRKNMFVIPFQIDEVREKPCDIGRKGKEASD